MPIIVGDIAGQYKAFLELLKKFPDDEVISVGDMCDRGPQSKEVIEWFMKNGKATLGNHEHMMLDYCKNSRLDVSDPFANNKNYYDYGVWYSNGGRATLDDSFGGTIPQDVLDWVSKLPLYLEVEGCLISHSFVYDKYVWFPDEYPDPVKAACNLGTHAMSEEAERSIIWNRQDPIRIDKYHMQISGHNSQMGLQKFADEKGEFALCIDDSRQKQLTAIQIPEYTICQQPYIG